MKTLLFTHLLVGLLQWFVLAAGFMYGVLVLLTWSTLIDFVGFLPLEIGYFILAVALGFWVISEVIAGVLSQRHDIEVSNTVFTPGMIVWMMLGILSVFYQFVISILIEQPEFIANNLALFERIYWPVMFAILILERTLRDPQGKVKNQIFQTVGLLVFFVGIGFGSIWLYNNGGVYGLAQEVTFQTPTKVTLTFQGGATFSELESINRFAPILYVSNRSTSAQLTYIWPTSDEEQLTTTFTSGKNEVDTRINHIRSFNQFAQETPTSDSTISSLNQATFTQVELTIPENSETIEKLLYIIEGQAPSDAYRTSLWGSQIQDLGITQQNLNQKIQEVEISSPTATNQ